jgi:nucleosome assembly protein 1-like 1
MIAGKFICEPDCPILANLMNVDADISEDNKTYKLLLEFRPNEFFENTQIEKEFIYEDDAEDEMPSKVKSSEIKWKDGKNVTKRIVKQVNYYF